MSQYDDENTVNDSPDGIDYDSRYDSDEYAQEYFMHAFGSEFEDKLNEIRDKVGRDQEEAVSIFADEIMRGYKTPFTTKAEMEEFIWSFIQRETDMNITTSSEQTKRNMDSIRKSNDALYLQLQMNSRKIANPQALEHIAKIAKELPQTKFLFDVQMVDEEIVADHLNGTLNYCDNSPMFALNSLYAKSKTVDVSLIQSFFGQDKLQTRAVGNALQFMAMSNPKPRDWVFVEAQRSERDAKFKWVVNLGAKYVFVQIQNRRQDYFIKEQLWNIGTLHAKSNNLVFVDGDVAYCQMDWLKHVAQTFVDGCELFQPHAWSWRASEPNGVKEFGANDLNLIESFGHARKLNKSSFNAFNGHTGYDIAISRRHYKKLGGFYSTAGTGGDFFNWCLLAQGNYLRGNQFEQRLAEILSRCNIPVVQIGSSDLICFHNYHGSTKNRARKYVRDLNGKILVANNFGTNRIAEVGV